MKPVLSAEEYRRVDKSHEGDLLQAMERAGLAVALAATRAGATYGSKVVVLAGPGNNGGDGYVAARYLKNRGADVCVQFLKEPSTREAIHAAKEARSAQVPIVPIASPTDAGVVIDSVFGGGSRRGLPDSIRHWMGTSAKVVAVDFPTGLDPDTGAVEDVAFRAMETVTFSTLKTGHVLGQGPDYCGHVRIADIGINGGESSMFVAEEEDAPLPSRLRSAHKWSAGAVLVIGGSQGLMGASILAGSSALAFGAGSVMVASPNSDLVQQMAPEIPSLDMEEAHDQLGRFDVVVAGPGLKNGDTERVVPLLRKAARVVLDAGGLEPDLLEAAKHGAAQVVVTPHDGEFRRIAGIGPGTYSTRAFADRHGLVVLRKGNPTMITDGCPQVLVRSGGPELASIGTGDVLAGMIGALWARGLEPMDAAVSAAYWHGVAAAELSLSRTVTAPGLIDQISKCAW